MAFPFIQLTNLDDAPVFVHIDHIVSFKRSAHGTFLRVDNYPDYYTVKETYQQVIDKLNALE